MTKSALAVGCWSGDKRGMVEIASAEDLRKWLEDKPRDWARLIAARTALRVLPYAFRQPTNDERFPEFGISLFRAAAISWAARNFPAHDMRKTADAAANAAALYEGFAVGAVANAATNHDNVLVSVTDAFDEATAAYNAITSATYSTADPAAAAYNTADFANHTYAATAPTAIWRALSADCDWLDQQDDTKAAARRLTREKLWLTPAPEGLHRIWQDGAVRLRALDPSFQVWIDWYDRRIRGERAAFDIPGDKNRVEDKKILARLADATDEDFWGKGVEYVNTTLQGWIDDARARVAPSSHAKLPVQNPNAITFRKDEDGRIAIAGGASADALRTDPEAQDRHAEAVAEARALLTACAGSNAGARLVRFLENYLEAAGEKVEGMRPSLFVQRGERLRQELAAYEQPDTDHPPLTSEMLADFKSWRSAHNLVVGLDPVLIAMDTAQLGPDVTPALITPDEVRMIARDADAQNILAEGVLDVMEETADLAPNPPVPGDRRTVWSAETARNLVIETFAMALNNPVKAAAVVVAAANPGLLGIPINAAGAGAAILFLMTHRQWIETRLGNYPTWNFLFVELCKWIEDHTPIRSPDKDK